MRNSTFGNGFYGKQILYDAVSDGPDVYSWNVYRICNDKSIANATKDDLRQKYLAYYTYFYNESFEFAGEKYYAVNVNQSKLYYNYEWDSSNVTFSYMFTVEGTYYEKENEYRLELVCYDNYAPISGIVFVATLNVTVLTCTVIWLVKRKKNEYKF